MARTSNALTPTMRTLAGVGIAAALLFLGLVMVNQSMTGPAGSPSNFTEVLGRTEVQGGGSGIEASGGALTDRGVRSQGSGASAESATPYTSDVSAEGPSEAATPHVARTEGEAFFTHTPNPRDAVAGSATVVVKGETEVRLTVAGSVHEGVALISASVENASNNMIHFDSGVQVLVDIYLDGAFWRTVDLSDSDVTRLRPGGSAHVTVELPVSAYGEYTLTGSAEYLAP